MRKMVDQLTTSIHPRVVNGYTQHEKKNTCKPPKDGGGKSLRKRTERLNRRLRDHATTLNSSKEDAKAYKRPGSMKSVAPAGKRSGR